MKKRICKIIKCLGISLVFILLVITCVFTWLWFKFPFPENRLVMWLPSTEVVDVQGRNMLSIVSVQEQWCRPVKLSEVSPWVIKATVATEDQRYYSHGGVDCLAVARAIGQNVASGKIVSGASTLTMQVCRMMDNRRRTYPAKAIEAFRALQLDCIRSKEEVLEIYFNCAPYGGNIRGIEAASQRYFGKRSKDLSLSEGAFLAGLPQSPGRYRPDKYMDRALKRRNFVLKRMLETGMISVKQYNDALDVPVRLVEGGNSPRMDHAAWMAVARRPYGGKVTIDLDIQERVEELAYKHVTTLADDSEVAVVVIDIKQSCLVALVGSADITDPVDGQVNGALAKRSPGSTLKPFIYAAAMEAGRLSGRSIVYDVPVEIDGWKPGNFDGLFSGEIPAAEALRKSLNIPAILIAEEVGLSRCCGILESVGISLPADIQRRSGLTLAVGGSEVSLMELTNAYAVLGREGNFSEVRLYADQEYETRQVLSADVCMAINDILSVRNRSAAGTENIFEEDIPWFMWKTGTSSGRRDAWAVGHNTCYAVGVWVGRFRGTGRNEYVGAGASEPLLGKLFLDKSLRVDGEPPVGRPIQVVRKIPEPRSYKAGIQITNPSNGDKFIALNDKVKFTPTADCESVIWFLNGKLLNDTDKGVNLTAGNYRISCVDGLGRSGEVSFTVR